MVAEVLRTGRLPNNLVGVLSSRLRVTDADGGFLPTELRREGGIHTFLGHLTAEEAPLPGLAGLTLIGVERAEVSHILHSFFSVPVRPFDPNHWLFGCREDITSEGPPRDHGNLCGFLHGTACLQCSVMGIPYSTSGSSLAFYLADESMLKGERQGQGTKPHLPRSHLHPSRRGSAPSMYGGERGGVFKTVVPPAGQLRASLRGCSRLDPVHLPRRL